MLNEGTCCCTLFSTSLLKGKMDVAKALEASCVNRKFGLKCPTVAANVCCDCCDVSVLL